MSRNTTITCDRCRRIESLNENLTIRSVMVYIEGSDDASSIAERFEETLDLCHPCFAQFIAAVKHLITLQHDNNG